MSNFNMLLSQFCLTIPNSSVSRQIILCNNLKSPMTFNFFKKTDGGIAPPPSTCPDEARPVSTYFCTYVLL